MHADHNANLSRFSGVYLLPFPLEELHSFHVLKNNPRSILFRSMSADDMEWLGGWQGQGHWQVWLREWQGTLMTAAERNVPSVYSWLEAQVDDVVRANNLTQVFSSCHVHSQMRERFGSI